jgi:hypothetical protein
VGDSDSSIHLITDANFHTFTVSGYRLMRNYVEMILALIVLNILHHKPTTVECCVSFTRGLKVLYQFDVVLTVHRR